VRPWLPISSEHLNMAVSVQESAPDALLHHYRRALSFRRAHPVLAKGDLGDLQVQGDVLSFVRSDGRDTIYVAVNMSDRPGVVDLPKGNWLHIGAELNSAGTGPDGRVHLGPWQPCIALKAP
jgi:alpha-glucosidase